MSLRDFLAALAGNIGTPITLKDSTDKELLTFNVEGYEAVESDILDYIVSSATLTKGPNTKITIVADVAN